GPPARLPSRPRRPPTRQTPPSPALPPPSPPASPPAPRDAAPGRGARPRPYLRRRRPLEPRPRETPHPAETPDPAPTSAVAARLNPHPVGRRARPRRPALLPPLRRHRRRRVGPTPVRSVEGRFVALLFYVSYNK